MIKCNTLFVFFLYTGRFGNPKKRILTCDEDVSTLFWKGGDSHSCDADRDMLDVSYDSKSIKLADITDIRIGTEIDPSTPQKALDDAAKVNGAPRNSIGSMFFRNYVVLFGTANLRRHCKSEDLEFCFSLILPDRLVHV